MRTAIIRNGVVDHIVIAGPSYAPPLGAHAIPSETANVGDIYDGANFIRSQPQASRAQLEIDTFAITKARLATARTFDVGAGVFVDSDLTSDTRIDLRDLGEWGAANPTGLRAWFDNDGRCVQLTGAQVALLDQNVRAAFLDFYARVEAVIEAIRAEPPTITTTEQINDALSGAAQQG